MSVEQLQVAKLKEIANDFYLGNIGTANSKYFRAIDELSKNSAFLANAKQILKCQENEDWVGLADELVKVSLETCR
ncbi:hypothetical protein AGMMS49938_03560 [Fibrobacterales bacterium]|nr:hypothetical protein AGMMS49938_03560 [Fibrobacterales bacterium]